MRERVDSGRRGAQIAGRPNVVDVRYADGAGALGVEGVDAVELADEGVGDVGVELGCASVADDVEGVGDAHCLLVDAGAGQGVEDVGDGDDSRGEGDVVAAEAGGEPFPS
jgi:hypothetical protein